MTTQMVLFLIVDRIVYMLYKAQASCFAFFFFLWHYFGVKSWGRFYETRVPEQVVVLTYPNFLLKFCDTANSNWRLGYHTLALQFAPEYFHCGACVFIELAPEQLHTYHFMLNFLEMVIRQFWILVV